MLYKTSVIKCAYIYSVDENWFSSVSVFKLTRSRFMYMRFTNRKTDLFFLVWYYIKINKYELENISLNISFWIDNFKCFITVKKTLINQVFIPCKKCEKINWVFWFTFSPTGWKYIQFTENLILNISSWLFFAITAIIRTYI